MADADVIAAPVDEEAMLAELEMVCACARCRFTIGFRVILRRAFVVSKWQNNHRFSSLHDGITHSLSHTHPTLPPKEAFLPDLCCAHVCVLSVLRSSMRGWGASRGSPPLPLPLLSPQPFPPPKHRHKHKTLTQIQTLAPHAHTHRT